MLRQMNRNMLGGLHHPMPPAAPSPRLRSDILELSASLEAPPEQYAKLESIIRFLKAQLLPRFGYQCKVEPFGSCSNGLWSHASDVDVTLILPQCNTKPKIVSKLRAARSFIRRAESPHLGSRTFIIEHARIPVLQMNMYGIQIDVSVNNISGVENSLLVRTWCRMDPRFVPLARTIKHWATMRNINDRSRGTLSTYTILLQLMFFLQTRSPPIVPKFAEFAKPHILSQPFDELAGNLRETPFDTSVVNWTHTGSLNHEELHTLFYEFFELWGNEELTNGVDVTNDVMSFPVTGVLSMHCPLTGNDVNVMNTTTWRKIHHEYIMAKNLLRKGATYAELIEGHIHREQQ